MLMQKEIEVLQDRLNKQVHIQLNFVDFVRKIEFNVEKSLLSRRNRQIMRQRIKENWLFKSKIIPPSFAKIGQENKPPRPKIFISPPSIINSSQTCPVTQHEISQNFCEPSVSNYEKMTRGQCKTSYDGIRKVNSYNRIKSSWKVQFRRDQLNVLQYQAKKSDDQASQWLEQGNLPKNFKVRRVPKKFEEIKHKSCKINGTNLQIEEKTYNFGKILYATIESSSIHRSKSPQ